MKVFETDRLLVRFFSEEDYTFFEELLNAPEIIEPVPQKPFPLAVVRAKFEKYTEVVSEFKTTERYALAVCPKGTDEVIGMCLLLVNDEGYREIGYRFRKKYWGKGFASEMTQGVIAYCFDELRLEKITADVTIGNDASSRILDKYFRPVKEFYNPNDDCMDRRYELTAVEWSSHE